MLWKQSDLVSEKTESMSSDDLSNEKSVQNDSDANEDNRQDIDFVYDDTDEYTSEIAELYSYTEEKEFFENQTYFYEEFRKIYGANAKWIDINDSERKKHIQRICDLLDSGQKDFRNKAARSLLYIYQGVFGECELEEDQITWTRHNVFLSLECGVISMLVDILLFEIKYEEWTSSNSTNGMNSDQKNTPDSGDNQTRNNRKPLSTSGSSLGSNPELRVVLNLLYTVIETVRSYKCKHTRTDGTDTEGRTDKKQNNNWMRLSDNLIEELNEGISSLGSVEDAPNLMIVLFGMIHRFCSGLAPNFPMKKVLLVLWKTALLILGPVTSMFELKNEKRASINLPHLSEDTHKIVKYMKATNFPTTNADFLEVAQPLIKTRPRNRLAVSSNQQGPSQGSFAEGRSKLMLGNNLTNNIGSHSDVDSNNVPNNNLSAGLDKNDSDDPSLQGDSESTVSSTSDTIVPGTNSIGSSNKGDNELDETSYVDEDDIDEDDDDENRVRNGSDDICTSGEDEDGSIDERLGDNRDDSLFDVDGDTMDNIPSKSNDIDSGFSKNNLEDSIRPDGISTPRPSSPTNLPTSNASIDMKQASAHNSGPPTLTNPFHDYKTLPWKPKVKTKDLEAFMENVRAKFIGYPISGQDNITLAGLPQPIQDAVKVLKNHLYISIGEVQIKNENDIIQFPLSIGSKEVIEETPVEKLYRNMLPLIPQYMIALLKILLAAAPTSKSKTESINILSEVVPDEIPITVAESYKLNFDVNRHKEIIVKAISGLLLLLLKHFKLNHIYQFEYVSQHLVFANCIPLVLKFFNQNILNYVQAKNSISGIDFPSCVIGEKMELNADALENSDQSSYCWRNVFSCINLLRILNMLTKWKHSRTMMMVVFKSPPILKRALKVRQAMLQLYVLKLLKSQTRYSGRQWRKTNMQIMSAIYQKVRHRLTDDWAYGNDVDARPWDFQAEECSLRTSVNRFNNRRYLGEILDPDFVPGDHDVMSVLSKRCSSKNGSVSEELPASFKDNYEKWLENEVFNVSVDWDRVLAPSKRLEECV